MTLRIEKSYTNGHFATGVVTDWDNAYAAGIESDRYGDVLGALIIGPDGNILAHTDEHLVWHSGYMFQYMPGANVYVLTCEGERYGFLTEEEASDYLFMRLMATTDATIRSITT